MIKCHHDQMYRLKPEGEQAQEGRDILQSDVGGPAGNNERLTINKHKSLKGQGEKGKTTLTSSYCP